MSILQLPNEIIQAIIQETIPGDFENVVLSCKAFHQLSVPLLNDYNTKRHRFRKFRYPQLDDRDEGIGEGHEAKTQPRIANALELAQYIARNPDVAHYIQTADLADDDLEESEDPEEDLIRGDTGPLLRLLSESPYLAEAGCQAIEWLEKMNRSLEGHVDALLLTLLPNVKHLAVPRRIGQRSPVESSCMWDTGVEDLDPEILSVMDVLVRRANDKSMADASLAKLEFVHPFAGPERIPLQSYEPFLALNSVRELYARDCVGINDRDVGQVFNPRYDRYSSSLEVIELHECALARHAVRDIVSRTPNLKVFRYYHDVKPVGCGSNIQFGQTLRDLMDYRGDTLEELVMHASSNLQHMGSTLMDMKGFQRLRVLELSDSALGNEPWTTDEKWTHDTRSGCCRGDEEGIPRLIDLLPSSVEVVRLYFGGLYEEDSKYAVLFDGLEEERQEKLPLLQEVGLILNMDERSGNNVGVLKTARACGATLTFVRRGMPGFAMHFRKRYNL